MMPRSFPSPSATSLPASAILWVAVSAAAFPAQAASVPVGNGSFELPSTTFVDTRIDLWNKTPQPDWFQPQGGITWDSLSGVFLNTPAGQPNHIVNADGNQAAFLIGLPQAGITQVLGSTYEAGLQYTVTVGVLAGGNITEGTSLLIGLFYVDDLGAPVSVAATTVSYSAAGFPNSTVLQDHKAVSGVISSGSGPAGKNIGIQIIGTSGAGEGYWDLDNVRVTTQVVPEPGTWALFALGFTGLALAGRRNRHGR